jgi:D-amino-acid oxidase
MLLTSRRAVLSSLGGLALSGCATGPLIEPPAFTPIRVAPLRMEMERLTRITVCTRPFRAAGPRLDVETVGDKRVVHNYGHGGAGWSLSWGSAEVATQRALEGGAKDIAVIGCGAIGLTTALTLQRAGAKVTIFAKERAPQTRSARATGTWSPDSRIADETKVSPDFPALWEQIARKSFATFQTYVGLPGDPVAWTDRYALYDTPFANPLSDARRDPGEIPFASYGDRLDGLTPRSAELPAGSYPFPVARVRRGTAMQFNVAELMHLLTADFLTEGGRIEPMELHTPADIARLPQRVVVNCTGYGARALFKDETVTPVRGQIAWLAPQPEVHYSLRYRGVNVVPRPDGIVVQKMGDSDMWGYGLADETPDRAEAEECISKIAALFARV